MAALQVFQVLAVHLDLQDLEEFGDEGGRKEELLIDDIEVSLPRRDDLSFKLLLNSIVCKGA